MKQRKKQVGSRHFHLRYEFDADHPVLTIMDAQSGGIIRIERRHDVAGGLFNVYGNAVGGNGKGFILGVDVPMSPIVGGTLTGLALGGFDSRWGM